MGSNTAPTHKPWVETPCIRSAALSREAGCNIYLKLESLQPSGSFKSRGIGHLMSRAIASNPSKPIHFYCSSGGNAGLACATAAISLQCSATIVVPTSTSPLMVSKLKTLGADVVQAGAHWKEADEFLREELLGQEGEEGVYVPPFDHEDVWEGNGTLVEELEEQMIGVGGYDAIVCSVGGGGLFSGIMGGLEKYGRLDGGAGKRVRVMAMETSGTDSLSQSLKAGELIRLPAITSIATSLGATQVCRKAFEWAQRKEVTSCVFSDAEAAMGSVRFADDERILVEAACGLSVAPAYNGGLKDVLFKGVGEDEFRGLNVVLVVCGGSNVTLRMLEGYRTKYANNEAVLKKFHKRRLQEEGKKSGKVENGVPRIMHSKLQHETGVEPDCVEKEVRRPATGTVGKGDLEKQI